MNVKLDLIIIWSWPYLKKHLRYYKHLIHVSVTTGTTKCPEINLKPFPFQATIFRFLNYWYDYCIALNSVYVVTMVYHDLFFLKTLFITVTLFSSIKCFSRPRYISCILQTEKIIYIVYLKESIHFSCIERENGNQDISVQV